MFTFIPWRPFQAHIEKNVGRKILTHFGRRAKKIFRDNMDTAKSGIHHPGLPRRSSAPGEFPANQFGPLKASIDYEVSGNRMVVGSNVFYSAYLREGTQFMSRRRMSDDALRMALDGPGPELGHWARWERL